MALVLNGTDPAKLKLDGFNLPANTGSFTAMARVKRLSAQTGVRVWFNILGATTSHEVLQNTADASTQNAPYLGTNWSIYSSPKYVLPVDTWCTIALVGTTISGQAVVLMYVQTPSDGWTVVQQNQTVFAPEYLFWGGDGVTGHGTNCKVANIRIWNAALTQAQVQAEAGSSKPIITANLASAKSGSQGTLAAALQGETGGAIWTPASGVSVDTDMPTNGPTVAASGDLDVVDTYTPTAPVVASVSRVDLTSVTVNITGIDPNSDEVRLFRFLGTDPTVVSAQVDTIKRTAYQGTSAVSQVTNNPTGSDLSFWAYAVAGTKMSPGSQYKTLIATSDLKATATESPDVAAAVLSSVYVLAAQATELPDIGLDQTAPEIKLYGPTKATKDYEVSASVFDSGGIASVKLYRGDTMLSEWTDSALHKVTETATYADNGTRTYKVVAVDVAGNQATQTLSVEIAVQKGGFTPTLTMTPTTLDKSGSIAVQVSMPSGQKATAIELLRNNVRFVDVDVTSGKATVLVVDDSLNGSSSWQVKVTDADGVVGYSASITTTINVPAAEVRIYEITPGLARMIEIPRQDTSRSLMFQLFDRNGKPLAGARPVVRISRDQSPPVVPTGIVSSTDVPGIYLYWPSADDVNIEGQLTVSVAAEGALPVAAITARVVTPYGAR